jgi:hypothetical protein
MIALSLRTRLVWLPENRCDFFSLQITHGCPVHFLYRNTGNLRALRDGQWFTASNKGEEAVDGGQSTVAGAGGRSPFILQVLEKRKDLNGIQIS